MHGNKNSPLMEDSLAVTCKAKYSITTQYNNHAPRYLPN